MSLSLSLLLVFTTLLPLRTWDGVPNGGVLWCKVIFVSNIDTVKMILGCVDVRLGL